MYYIYSFFLLKVTIKFYVRYLKYKYWLFHKKRYNLRNLQKITLQSSV